MAIKEKLDQYMEENFTYERLEDVIGERFGRYSKYIIQDRAIPDVRDGLKPVQRRILYGMSKMGITSNTPYKKSARIVGEVMGKYHPHGDSSIYDAMVHLSQDWKMGVTLIDMHGNNGSIDGDGAAAMRYTEARMSKNADYLLKDIEKNTVPFVPNFDEEELEPTVLPGLFPNLLVNGAMGISSGFATYIPTHNLTEVINSIVAKIDKPDLTLDELLSIMPGPDFPTGGIVEGIDGIREAFNTGSGKVIVRCKYTFEDISKDQKRIAISEIPFDTNKAKICERIDQLRIDRKVEDIIEIRDESDRTGLRIAIDLKKGANEKAIMTYLLKNTDLQINLNYNMVVINNRRPERLGVLKILDAYITHQKEVFTNKTQFDLAKASKRQHIVEGLIKMVSILDQVIDTIRHSQNKANAKENLVAKFAFSEEQAEAIVMMQLYRLTNTDVLALSNEHDELTKSIDFYNKVLSSEKELLKLIKHDLLEMGKVINQPRRTDIIEEVTNLKVDESDLISKEDVMVIVTKEGYLKRVGLKAYGMSKINTVKENDAILFEDMCSTLDTLLLFTNSGSYCALPVYKIEECKTKDNGEFINNIIQINPGDKFISCYVINNFKENRTILIQTKEGLIKQTALPSFELSRYTKAARAMKISAGDEVVATSLTDNPLEIITLTKSAEALRYRASDVSLYGTQASGVKACALKPKDEIVSSFYANKNDDIMLLTTKGFIKRIKVEDLPISHRGRATTPVIKKIKSNPHYLADGACMTPNQYKENVEINIIYTNGNDIINTFDFKYNSGEAGKQILKSELGSPIQFVIASPKQKDAAVDDEYLLDKTSVIDLFNLDDDIIEDVPKIKADKQSKNILAEMEAILAENGLSDDTSKKEPIKEEKKQEEVKTEVKIVKKSVETQREKTEDDLPFKKVSLFGDDDIE